MRSGVRVDGLTLEQGRVTAVRVDGGSVESDLVVDALGRRTPRESWLRDVGVAANPPDTSDCGVVYYSRYYRVRDGFELPDGPWLLSPRADLGYIAYATFPGDNRTFAALLSAPSGVAEWRAFSEPEKFEAAVSQIPVLRQWVDPDGVEPITNVMPMAGLRNTFHHFDPLRSVGLAPVGDAFAHSDPVLAHGLSFALLHSVELAAAIRDHADAGDAVQAYVAATAPALRERYEFATALDAQRHRMWLGEQVDFARHDGDYALFSMAAAGAASMIDPDVFRVFVRRIGLLDSTEVLDSNIELQLRIEELFAEIVAKPRPAHGPSREQMLAVIGVS